MNYIIIIFPEYDSCTRGWTDDANSVVVSNASWFEGHEDNLDNKE